MVVADQLFALPDGRGYATSPLTYGVSLMVSGNSLFETLLFNLLPYNAHRPMRSNLSEDKPWWEYDEHSAPRKGIPLGYVSYLTWPYRRLLLCPPITNEPLQLTHVIRQAGNGLDKKWVETLFDPMVSYNWSDRSGFPNVHLQEDRTLWRDSHSLLGLVRFRDTQEPGYAKLLGGAEQKMIHVFGVSAVRSRVDLWRHERLPLPSAYLTDKNLIEALREGLSLAEDVAKILNGSVRFLASKILESNENKQVDRQSINQLVKHFGADRAYWSRLEGLFKAFMIALPEDSRTNGGGEKVYGTAQLPTWALQLRHTATNAFDEATRGLDRSARSLKAQAEAERVFYGRVKSALKDYLTPEEGEEYGADG